MFSRLFRIAWLKLSGKYLCGNAVSIRAGQAGGPGIAGPLWLLRGLCRRLVAASGRSVMENGRAHFARGVAKCNKNISAWLPHSFLKRFFFSAWLPHSYFQGFGVCGDSNTPSRLYVYVYDCIHIGTYTYIMCIYMYIYMISVQKWPGRCQSKWR